MTSRPLKLTNEAIKDVGRVLASIGTYNMAAASGLRGVFLKAVSHLKAFPMLGRVGVARRTRQLVIHKNYRLIYQVEDDYVEVVALHHVRRQSPFGA